MRLILASGSPRRANLLRQIGLGFEISAPDVDESRYPDEEPVLYVERIARAKVEGLVAGDAVVVGGDTAVVHEGKVLGKPAHPEEARGMLRRLQGNSHDVMTGAAVASFSSNEVVVRTLVDVAEVEMLAMTGDEIADYVATGEPLDKAGAYALQGVGGRFVKRVSGSPSTVIGLPLHLLSRLFEAVGSDLSMFAKGRSG